MITFSIDEITDVLQYSDKCKLSCKLHPWKEVAEYLIRRFELNTDLVGIFGVKTINNKAPEGYTNAYTYGCHGFYFAVAYHEFYKSMGIIVKFSAQALDYYLEQKAIRVNEFLKLAEDEEYTQRLSRIDLTADFIDEGIDLTNMYKSLSDGTVAVFNKILYKKSNKTGYKKIPLKNKSTMEGKEVETINIGSEASDSFLRIYDKRKEQISRCGNKLEMALSCKDWVRFEGVFRNDYAHQLSEQLVKVQTKDELLTLIVSTLCNKYNFMTVENGQAKEPTCYTKMMCGEFDLTFKLSAPRHKNYDLANNISYIIQKSGLMNTLYKIKVIWGMKAVDLALEYIKSYFENSFIPKGDRNNWVSKNCNDYQLHYPEFSDFINDNLLKITEKGDKKL